MNEMVFTLFLIEKNQCSPGYRIARDIEKRFGISGMGKEMATVSRAIQ